MEEILAGVGLTLDRLTSRGSFASAVQALAYCCVVSCGPWLFTITCLAAISWLAARHVDASEAQLFGNIIIYNFAFSLVALGPLTLVCTRYLSDSLYRRSVTSLNGVCVGAMALAYIISLSIAAPFYLFFTDLTFAMAVAAITNFTLVSMLWLSTTLLNAIKNFDVFLVTFLFGMLLAFFAGSLLMHDLGALGMIWGFNSGLFLIVFIAIGVAISQYASDIAHPFAFMTYFARYWDLALCGIIYYSAIWIDKWIMWLSADNVVVARNIVFNPSYDFPMFLAYLSMIPALSLLMFHMETGFLHEYNLFYREIERHATHSWLVKRCGRMVGHVLASLKDITLLQAAVTICALALSPLLIEMSGGEFRQLAVLRLGLLAAFLQIVFTFVSIQLYYFDLRKLNLALQSGFLLSNGLFTYLSSSMGFAYYGYGYFLSCLLTSSLSLIILAQVLKRLPYITFVSNNPSVR